MRFEVRPSALNARNAQAIRDSSLSSVAASFGDSGASVSAVICSRQRDQPLDRLAALCRQADQQPALVDVVLGQFHQPARLQPVDHALHRRRIHGDQAAELVLRGLADIGEFCQRRELRRRQVGDPRGEDRDMALMRLAQHEADLFLQPVVLRRGSASTSFSRLLSPSFGRLAHLSPSQALISSAASPPMRLWTRGPIVMARQNRISSGRGPSVMPTSMASKWLRT